MYIKDYYHKYLLVVLLVVWLPKLVVAQTHVAPHEVPTNLRVIAEYEDGKGNMVRTIMYDKNHNRIKETVIIPIKPKLVIKPINPDTLIKDSIYVVIDKKAYSLDVFYRQKKVRSYKAVFGPKPLENKQIEGDRCTPEGWFTISNKHISTSYNKFLQLNYPNDSAYIRFNQLKKEGKIAKHAAIGGNVGIHGIWKGGEDMIELGVGWTDGCIALKNKDVDELYSWIKVGTRVLIHK